MTTGPLTKVFYTGQRGALFGLAFKTALLTVLTLGIYRFWAKTRIRRYVWSSVSIDGDRLEYTWTGQRYAVEGTIQAELRTSQD